MKTKQKAKMTQNSSKFRFLNLHLNAFGDDDKNSSESLFLDLENSKNFFRN